MQAAHSSSSWGGLPFGSAGLALPLPLPFPRLGTCGVRDGPHAASPITVAAATAASPPDRRYVLFISQLLLTHLAWDAAVYGLGASRFRMRPFLIHDWRRVAGRRVLVVGAGVAWRRGDRLGCGSGGGRQRGGRDGRAAGPP